jgi:hypothetical protein
MGVGDGNARKDIWLQCSSLFLRKFGKSEPLGSAMWLLAGTKFLCNVILEEYINLKTLDLS